MALIWADFPSGQWGLYALDTSLMLSGVWAGLEAGVGGERGLVADPDPGIGSNGVVFFVQSSSITAGSGARIVLPSAQATVGIGVRLWMSHIPVGNSNENNPEIIFRSSGNAAIVRLRVLADGSIRAFDGAGTTLGTSDPCLTAQSYNHIEAKVVRDAAAGIVEVRVNGSPVLELDTLALGVNNIGIAFIGAALDSGQVGGRHYYKDFILWDGSGSEVKDFQGSVGVYDLYTNADDDFNWDTSRTGGGGEGFDLIADHKPYNLLSKSGTPDPRIADNDTISIAGTYYRWTSGTVDPGGEAGTSANPWRVALGADDAEAFANMAAAINLTGTPGTTYSTGLVAANSACIAVNWTGSVLQIEPIDGVTRAIAVTETGANLAWSNASTFPIGPTDTSFIEAGFTAGPVFPDPSKFELTDLPPDVTSVRALLSIARAMKTDGGDCNLQMALTPNDTDFDDGADRPVTTAFTYWWDVSHVSPATSAPWTPAEVNDTLLQVDRTL